MASNNQNFRIDTNTHLNVIFQVDNVIDLFDYCIVWGVYDRMGDLVLIKSSVDETEISKNETKFTIYLKPGDIANLDIRTYYHEVRITNPHGSTSVVARGYMGINKSLTTVC